MKFLAACMILVMLGWVSSGCSYRGGITLLNEGITPGPPRFYGTVKVFVHRDIGMDVIELGSVSVAIQAEVPGTEYVTLMQKEAAKIGADAVVGYQQEGTTATGIAVKFRKK
jgi:hypothetical protein